MLVFKPSFADETSVKPSLNFVAQDQSNTNPSKIIWGGFDVTLYPGWHTYWKWNQDAGTPLQFEIEKSSNVQTIDMLWPMPIEIDYYGIQLFGYKKSLIVPLRITLEDPTKPFMVDLKATILFCDDSSCNEYHYSFSYDSINPQINQVVPFNTIQSFIDLVPAKVDRSLLSNVKTYISRFGDDYFYNILLKNAKSSSNIRAVMIPDQKIKLDGFNVVYNEANKKIISIPFALDRAASSNTNNKIYDFNVYLFDGGQYLEYTEKMDITKFRYDYSKIKWIILYALLGGLILNLMPCVLPILFLKSYEIAKLSKDNDKQVRLSCLFSVFGILFSFLIFSLIAIGFYYVGMMATWGMHFQNPIFVFVMAAFITILTCNLFGFYEIMLPGITIENEEQRGNISHFFNGMLATILAIPCSAPFLGTAVGYGLSQSPGVILMVFLAIGFGFSSPYLIMAAFPSRLRNILPKPGRWMVILKYIVGFTLLAVVAWLLWILSDMVTVFGIIMTIILILVILISLFLIHFLEAEWIKEFVWIGILAAVISVGAVIYNSELLVQQASIQSNWEPFSPSKIQPYIQDDKVIFINFTAKWCVTCKFNEKFVLDRRTVQNALKQPHVIAMVADWTSPNPVIANFLKRYNQSSIPFYIVFSKKYPRGKILSPLLREDELLEALQ